MENGNWLQIFKIDFVSKKRNRVNVSIYAKCFFFFISCVCVAYRINPLRRVT